MEMSLVAMPLKAPAKSVVVKTANAGCSMKISIIYNGNPADTVVVDAETGEPLEGITDVQINIEPEEAFAVLVFTDFEAKIANIEAEALYEPKPEDPA